MKSVSEPDGEESLSLGHHGSAMRRRSSGRRIFSFFERFGSPGPHFVCWYSDSAVLPASKAAGRMSHVRLSTETSMRSLSSNSSYCRFARRSASRLPSLGAHSTTVRKPIFFMYAGNFVVISLISTAPFPRFSVSVGQSERSSGVCVATRRIQVSVPPERPENSASISQARLSYTHGQSFTTITSANHGGALTFTRPSVSTCGYDPPIPVLVLLACASTLAVVLPAKRSTVQEYCLDCGIWSAR